MKISLSWLSDYIDIPFTPKQLDERLTMLGIEVEAIEDLARKFDKIVVGEVLEVIPHPNADKLSLTRVSTGSGEPLRIVCGAPNVREGLKVAVATIGADLGGGIVIKKSKIRGEASEGMLCSEKELGMSEEHNGIWELPNELAVGAPLAKALGKEEVVLEIGITPNRADCLSHIGIAREIAAITDQEIRMPAVASSRIGGAVSEQARVTIMDPELCPRYAAKIVRGVKIGPSPDWLRARVESIGLRSINNVVDVTNFVLMEIGHPLHAFDLDQISNAHIIVRRAKDFAEEFTTLDGKKRKLDPETLLIADDKGPLGIAGIMGGQNSEISESSTNIFIESAYFQPSSIRRSAKKQGLSTDASYRFERGTDPEIVLYAVERAAELIAQVGGGALVEGTIDEYPEPQPAKRFNFRPSRANKLLGTTIAEDQMEKVLTDLNIRIVKTDAGWELEAPTYRVDLNIEEDAIEEVARIVGYDVLPISEHAPVSLGATHDPLPVRTFDELVRSTLLSLGFNEAVSTPIVSKADSELFSDKPVALINPLNVEMDRMRSSIAINLLDAARRNERFGATGQRIFEIGNVFEYDEAPQLLGHVRERAQIALIVSGIQEAKSPYNSADQKADLLQLAGVLRTLASRLGLRESRVTAAVGHSAFESGLALDLIVAGKQIGSLGKISQKLGKAFDLRQDCFIALLDHKELYMLALHTRKNPSAMKPLPKYPAVERDLALVLDHSVRAQDLLDKAIGFVDKKLLESSSIFDEFRSPEMKKAGERSLGIRLRFRSAERTLEEQEIDEVMKKVVEGLGKEMNARLRS